MGFYKWHCPKGNNVNSPTFQRGDSVAGAKEPTLKGSHRELM